MSPVDAILLHVPAAPIIDTHRADHDHTKDMRSRASGVLLEAHRKLVLLSPNCGVHR